ncbi:hypothetical protein C2S52_013917 [Perilla frutescens var. hirtella]|nr:hypothetical protein C2S51_016167 [Perilla frutescens var. frutescens]KAH6776356.1 hypothetical protein C2S52_013917 [Perilla frutescens var. hirtella]
MTTILFSSELMDRAKLWRKKSLILEEILNGLRNYSTKSNRALDLSKLKPMIMKRIEQRAKDYPVEPTLPMAREVVRARNTLYHGVSTLIHRISLLTCK